MPIACPNCSNINPDQSTFCVKCGNQFSAASATPSPWGAPPAQVAPASYPSPAQMSTGQELASLRRAFAGHGTLIRHHSWLLDGKQTQALSVLPAIRGMLLQPKYAGFNVAPERLTEHGIVMEQRDYLTVTRGASTIFVYVAPAGNDLYISRATMALPAISNVRVVTLGPLFLLMFFIGLFTLGHALSALLLLLFFFVLFLIGSFLQWLIEKDFWAYLRPNTLKDFQLDDTALLEHATDRVIRDAVQQLGLDASQITPPVQGYQPKRRIRTI